MTEPRVALVTCADLPAADADTRLLIAPLAARGVRAEPVVWDDPRVDWSAFELGVIRSCWDYSRRRAEFLSWARSVPRLANSCDVIAWNTDKQYLAQLVAIGIGVVPTAWVQPTEEWSVPEPRSTSENHVVKPAVSLAALDTGRYDLGDSVSRRLAVEHVHRLQNAGRLVMVQPYLATVDTQGEASLVFIAGRFSHAILKGPVLDGPDRGVDRRFAANGGALLNEWDPTAAQLALAYRALAAVPGGRSHLLYARVDMVSDDRGEPLIMEVELTEPQLYLARARQATDRLAWAIAIRAGSS